MPETDAATSGPPCPECQQPNPAGTRFCSQCGLLLQTSAAAAAEDAGAGGSRVRRRRDDPAKAALARQEFARVKQVVLYLRTLFWVGALLSLLIAAFWQLAVAAAGTGSLAETLVTLLVWGGTALMVAGAVFVVRAPLAWSVVAACLYTLDVAILVVTGGGAVALAVKGLMALACWAAVAQSARVQKLMAAHPDLQIVRRRIGVDRQVRGGISEAERRHQKTRKREAVRSWLRWSGLLPYTGGATGVAAVVLWLLLRPPSVEPSVERFAQLWNSGDTVTLAQLLADADAVRGELTRRGWDRSPPGLTTAQIEQQGDIAHAAFTLAGASDRVVAHWERSPRDWALRRVEFPDVEAGELERGLEAFQRAWEGEGLGELMMLLTGELRDKRSDSIRRVLEHRQWADRRPGLGRVRVHSNRNGHARVTWAVDGGELTVRFEWWHPQWRVAGFSLPRDS